MMSYNFDGQINRFGTMSVKYDGLRKFFGRSDLMPLWVADMDFRTPDFIIEAIQKRLEHEILGYTLRSNEFDKAFVDWAEKRYNWQVKNNWLSFSPGVVAALTLSIEAFSEKNDAVVIQTPVYPPFFDVVEGNGRRLKINKLKNEQGRFTMDFDDLRQRIDDTTKIILLSNPHNPVGRVWTVEELTQLVEIAEKYDLIIISDEIHGDIIYRGHRHIPLASISPKAAERTISVFSPSKTFNIAGLSTSIVVCENREMLKKYNDLLVSHHLFLGNIFGAVAFEAAYKNGEIWLEQLLDYLEQNVDYVIDFFAKNLPKLRINKPDGTFLLWLDFSEYSASHEEIFDILKNKAKVALNDGKTFGKCGEKYFRMNIATPRSNLEKALQAMNKALQTVE